MWYLLYNVLLLIASPVVLAILLAKKRCRRGLSQRLGWTVPDLPQGPDRSTIWIHAVSLGEVVAVVPLVNELHRRHSHHRFVVSTVTETGREAVEQRLAGVASHCYAPLDFPWAVARVTERLSPCLYVFVETELWPNLLRHLRRSGVPTVLVNGRLSTRSYTRQRWGPVRLFYGSMLRLISLCLMQSDRDVERIVALGADARNVQRTGNIKFDQPTPPSSDSIQMRADLGLQPHEQLFVAGSTHPGEEELLVDGYRALVAAVPSAVLLLAPRHIERASSVEAMVRARGMTVYRRSAMASPASSLSAGPRVVILDTRGELASIYREAVVTFVGGTLVPVGGHNLLEPAVWEKPVLFGPYTDHCADIADLLIQAGGGRRVTQLDLSQQVIRLFHDQAARLQMGRSARQVIQQNQGALHRTVEAIDRMMVSSPADRHASPAGSPLPLMAGR